MCECYTVGGPWIAEDPNCPVHGTEAQREQESEAFAKEATEQRIADLEEHSREQAAIIAELREDVSRIYIQLSKIDI